MVSNTELLSQKLKDEIEVLSQMRAREIDELHKIEEHKAKRNRELAKLREDIQYHQSFLFDLSNAIEEKRNLVEMQKAYQKMHYAQPDHVRDI